MAALRQVILTLPETRATDFLLVADRTYKVIEWHALHGFVQRQHRLEYNNQIVAKVQRIDLDDDYAKMGEPIHIVVGMADALQVLVPTA